MMSAVELRAWIKRVQENGDSDEQTVANALAAYVDRCADEEDFLKMCKSCLEAIAGIAGDLARRL